MALALFARSTRDTISALQGLSVIFLAITTATPSHHCQRGQAATDTSRQPASQVSRLQQRQSTSTYQRIAGSVVLQPSAAHVGGNLCHPLLSCRILR